MPTKADLGRYMEVLDWLTWLKRQGEFGDRGARIVAGRAFGSSFWRIAKRQYGVSDDTLRRWEVAAITTIVGPLLAPHRGPLVSRPQDPPHPGVTRVVAMVAAARRVPAAEILARGRGRKQAALARQVAIYLCRVGLELPQEVIGHALGRDHATVSYAVARIEDRRDDRAFDQALSDLEQRVAQELGRPVP